MCEISLHLGGLQVPECELRGLHGEDVVEAAARAKPLMKDLIDDFISRL
jgi:hypothetical protein